MPRVKISEETNLSALSIARTVKRSKGKQIASYTHSSPSDGHATKVDFCSCGQTKNHDEGSEFFVTCVREAGKPSQRTLPILGPYATHEEALGNVDRGRVMAEAKDAWSHFDAFGTAKSEAGKWKGVFGI